MAGVRLTGSWNKLQGIIGKTIPYKMRRSQTMTEAIGEALVASTRERFETGKRPDGSDWKESERVKKEDGQTLVDTAILKNSIGYEASRKAVVVGTVEIYGAIHQLGGKAGRGKKVKIPERAYLGISEDDKDEIRGTVEDFMGEGLS